MNTTFQLLKIRIGHKSKLESIWPKITGQNSFLTFVNIVHIIIFTCIDESFCNETLSYIDGKK